MIGEKRELFRIQALVDIPAHGVKAGDLGGYVERERCLSRRGDSWAGGRAEGTAKLDGASLLMHTRISSGTVTGEQPRRPPRHGHPHEDGSRLQPYPQRPRG